VLQSLILKSKKKQKKRELEKSEKASK